MSGFLFYILLTWYTKEKNRIMETTKFKRDLLSFEFKQMMRPCLEKIFENKSKTGTLALRSKAVRQLYY